MQTRKHPNIGGKRWCNDCEAYKPLSEFYRNYQYHQTICKPCRRVKMRGYRREGAERKAAVPHDHIVLPNLREPSLDRVREDILIKDGLLWHVRCGTPLSFEGAEYHLDGREERWWCYVCLESVYAVAPGGHSALVAVAV